LASGTVAKADPTAAIEESATLLLMAIFQADPS
jgi:hypothetical protein